MTAEQVAVGWLAIEDVAAFEFIPTHSSDCAAIAPFSCECDHGVWSNGTLQYTNVPHSSKRCI